jgi:DnaJ-class molecular chaperone
MAEGETAMTECPRCGGRGKYADPRRALVSVRCERCDGSGQVPADSVTDDDRPATVTKKVPWAPPPRRF